MNNDREVPDPLATLEGKLKSTPTGWRWNPPSLEGTTVEIHSIEEPGIPTQFALRAQLLPGGEKIESLTDLQPDLPWELLRKNASLPLGFRFGLDRRGEALWLIGEVMGAVDIEFFAKAFDHCQQWLHGGSWEKLPSPATPSDLDLDEVLADSHWGATRREDGRYSVRLPISGAHTAIIETAAGGTVVAGVSIVPQQQLDPTQQRAIATHLLDGCGVGRHWRASIDPHQTKETIRIQSCVASPRLPMSIAAAIRNVTASVELWGPGVSSLVELETARLFLQLRESPLLSHLSHLSGG